MNAAPHDLSDPRPGLPRRLRDASAAFRLVCACCAWPPSEARRRQVGAAAVGVDWEALVRVAARQRVVGLVSAGLRGAGVAAPASVQARLEKAAQAAALRGLALAAESSRLQRSLAADGVPALAIKGASLAQLAYGGQGLKQGRDIDMLVAPADALRALALLKADGYRVLDPAMDLPPSQMSLLMERHKDLELFHPERRSSVELHWRLVDNPQLLPDVTVASPSQPVEGPAGELRTLADPELFAYLCVHGASHCWFRLKWLADLNAWISGKSDEEILSLHGFACGQGVGDCADQALLLCRDLLGWRAPPGLERALARPRARLLAAVAVDAMTGGGGERELADRPLGSFRLLPWQFFRGRGPRFMLAQWALVAWSLEDMLLLPLPRALHFLYPLLRLPLWLVRLARRHRLAAAAGPPA